MMSTLLDSSLNFTQFNLRSPSDINLQVEVIDVVAV